MTNPFNLEKKNEKGNVKKIFPKCEKYEEEIKESMDSSDLKPEILKIEKQKKDIHDKNIYLGYTIFNTQESENTNNFTTSQNKK